MSGFQRTRSQNDGGACGTLESYSVDASHATLLAIGDVVVLTGTADAEGRAGVDAAAPGAAFTGVVAGFDFDPGNLLDTGLPALTAGVARVHVDPNIVYEVDVVNGPLGVADVGLNADIDATAATRSGGITTSNMTLDAATALGTATLQFRIVGLLPDEAGVLGNRAVVRPNETTIRGGTAGV